MCTAFKCTIPLLCTVTPGIAMNAVFHLLSSSRYMIGRGYVAAQLLEALRYKPEGRGFDSWWSQCNFSLTQSFWLHYGPEVDSSSNRNEYQEYFLGSKGGRCIGLTTLSPSCANCYEICGASTSWNPQGLSRPVQGLLCYMSRVWKAKKRHVYADREIFYAYYGNTAIDLDPLPVSRSCLTMVELVLFE